MTPQPPTSVERVSYTPAQFAKALGITEPSVRRYIRTGLLEATKLGGRWLIPATEATRLFGKTDAA